MKTEFARLTGDFAGDDAILKRAAGIVKRGGLVAFPTETVYGLGASAYDEGAAKRIFEAKQRPGDNPLIVHISRCADADSIAYTNNAYYALARAFMPGPLTVILKKRDIIPLSVTGGLDTVAVRCPSHPAARRLIELAALPIAAPSANKSGTPSPTTARHVMDDLNGRIDMIIDGGECEIGLESTVVSLSDASCEILRPGAVTKEMLLSVLPSVTVSRAVLEPSKAGDSPRSPGMKYKHYAPRAEVLLVEAGGSAFKEYVRSNARDGDAVICAEGERFDGLITLPYGPGGDSAALAHRYYTLLRTADEKKARRVFIRGVKPDGGTLALYNRLIRSAAGKVIILSEK